MALGQEVEELNTDGISEARLMRACGHLYVSISIESFVTTCMGLVFTYLLLLITNKGRLEKPGHALWQFIRSHLRDFLQALINEYSMWPSMKTRSLDERFALCRKMNQAVCLLQIVLCVLTVERWLHIRNVNGFRYFGYSLTCPPMQTQLLILIAPVVPCYRLVCVITFAVTMVMLWLGYAASLMDSALYNGDLILFLASKDLRDLQPTPKLWLSSIAFVILCYLNLVQIPWLFFLYKWHGGKKSDLPPSYSGILAIVSLSWFAFPAWWLLSYEGMSVITDTKMSAAIFAILNIGSKAGFTLQMLHMVRLHRMSKKINEAAAAAMVRQVSPDSVSTVGLFDPHDDEQPHIHKTDTWVVRVLRPYDAKSDEPESWIILEQPFRVYLQLEGLSPTTWAHLPVESKLEYRRAYTEEYEQTAVKQSSEEGEIQEDASQLPTDSTAEDVRLETGNDSQVSRLEAAVEEALEDTLDDSSPGPKIGQVVTIADGRVGVVTECTGEKIKFEQTVDISDITCLKVIILSASGLLSSKDPDLELRCSCSVQALPESEVETPAAEIEGLKAIWNHEVDIFSFCPGSPLLFQVWGSSRGEDNILLGETHLSPELLRERGFRGQLSLDTATGQRSEGAARLDVAVEVANLPDAARQGRRRKPEPSNRCLYDSMSVMLGLPSKGHASSPCLPRLSPI